MSPIDQAFLKAFASAGRPSVAVAPRAPSGPCSRSVSSSQPPSAALSADTPKPALAIAGRPRNAESAVDPAARLVLKNSTVSSPRITLSEAIALRQSQRIAAESVAEATAAESVTEATAARLAQLTARWEATVAESEAGVEEPLQADAESGPTFCQPEGEGNNADNQTVEAEASGDRSSHHVTGNERDLATAPPGVENHPIDPAANARVDEPQPKDSGIPSSDAEQLAGREPCIECPSPAGLECAVSAAKDAATAKAMDHAEDSLADRPAVDGWATAGTNGDASEAAPILRLLRPAIQLERFAWPSLVSRWTRGCGEQLDAVADALFRAMRSEQRIIGFTSCRPGEGVSSVVLAAARRLSQRRCRFAVLEGNWDAPQMARRLALLGNDGWEAVIEGRRDLTDVMVGADEGRAAVVPALRAPAVTADPPRIAETYDLLRQNYEIILVDLPPRGCGTRCLGTLCDSVVLVQHPRQTRFREIQQYAEQWSSEGVGVLGVVQNGLN